MSFSSMHVAPAVAQNVCGIALLVDCAVILSTGKVIWWRDA